MLKKLQVKFVCVNMLIVTVMLCIIFGLVFHFTAENLKAESTQTMQTIAAAPKHPGFPGDPTDQVRLPYFVIQITPWGDLVASGNGYFDLSDTEYLAKLAAQALETGETSGKLEDHQLRFLLSNGPGGESLIFVDTSSEDATMQGLVRNCIIISILSIVLFFGLSILFARWAIKPVASAWAQQKQFVADASHELKTPLTVIMTNAEMLQSGDHDLESRQQFTASILTMTAQMRGLVEGLLDLARADNGSARMEFADTDLSQLVENAVLTFEPLFFEKGLILESHIQEGITLKGSTPHLHQVTEILLDNAMKYSTPGSTVFLGLARQGSHCLLSVSSPGEEISADDLKNIFKRFYRLDKVRSRDGSYGLGLSIAEAIVTAHHGKIWAESRNGTNTFRVQLPN